MTTRPAIDREELLERLGGDRELVGEILGLFDDECVAMLDAIEHAVRAADAPRLERAAHTLKGALLNISAGPGAEIAATLEELGHAGSVQGAEAPLGSLRGAMERLRRELQAVSA